MLPTYLTTDPDGPSERSCELDGRRMCVEDLLFDPEGRRHRQSLRDTRITCPDRVGRFLRVVALRESTTLVGLGLWSNLDCDPSVRCTTRRARECCVFPTGKANGRTAVLSTGSLNPTKKLRPSGYAATGVYGGRVTGCAAVSGLID